jgi:type II secretory pathway component PulM
MDSIVVVGGIVLFVLFGPWVLVWRVNVRHKREREEDQGQRRALTSRLFALEQTVQKLQGQHPGSATDEATGRSSERPVTASYTPPLSPPRHCFATGFTSGR